MARATPELITALRLTAARLDSGVRYRWTHMGACNCGHLAQTVTRLSRAEIHRIALERAGDWGEQTVEYCAQSNLPMDHVIARLLELGLELRDLRHLERLDDPDIRRALPPARRRCLDFRSRADAVLYMQTWAGLLDAELRAADAAAGDTSAA